MADLFFLNPIHKLVRFRNNVSLNMESISAITHNRVSPKCIRIITWKIMNIYISMYNPDRQVHGANMGPTWVLSAPDGPHVGPMNLAMKEVILVFSRYQFSKEIRLSIWQPSTINPRLYDNWWRLRQTWTSEIMLVPVTTTRTTLNSERNNLLICKYDMICQGPCWNWPAAGSVDTNPV